MDKGRLKRISDDLAAYLQDGSLSCARAHEMSLLHEVLPQELGAVMDDEGLKIVHCQLGLFGYGLEKKIVRPMETIPEFLASRISELLVNGELNCSDAWLIAGDLGIARIEVANACEALGIKICKCQLGAF